MFTSQEIRDVKFDKAVFGGYDMTMVDDFMERVSSDYGELMRENAALKGKLKVLADKIEEYRGVDDSMRKALLNAQNMAKEMVEEAETRSKNLLANATIEAQVKMSDIKRLIEAEEKKLEITRSKTSAFVSELTAKYKEQVEGLIKISKIEKLDIPPISAGREEAELTSRGLIKEEAAPEPQITMETFTQQPPANESPVVDYSIFEEVEAEGYKKSDDEDDTTDIDDSFVRNIEERIAEKKVRRVGEPEISKSGMQIEHFEVSVKKSEEGGRKTLEIDKDYSIDDDFDFDFDNYKK